MRGWKSFLNVIKVVQVRLSARTLQLSGVLGLLTAPCELLEQRRGCLHPSR